MRYRVLQPMRFIVGGGPGDEALEVGTMVDGVPDQHLQREDARSLKIQRKWHRKRGLEGTLAPFRWGGQVRQGVIGGDKPDLDPGR